jgi:hypothetical protein
MEDPFRSGDVKLLGVMDDKSDRSAACVAAVYCASCWLCFIAGWLFHWMHAGDSSQCYCHHLPPSASVLVEEPSR